MKPRNWTSLVGAALLAAALAPLAAHAAGGGKGDKPPALTKEEKKQRDIERQFMLANYAVVNEQDLKKAAAELKKLLQIDPKNLRANLMLVELSLKQDQKKEAVAALEKLAKKFPDEPVIPRNIAVIKLDLGDEAGGLAALQKVIAMNPGDHEVQLALFQFAYRKWKGGDASQKMEALARAKDYLRVCPLRRSPQFQGVERAFVEMAGDPMDLTIYDARKAYDSAFNETMIGRINSIMAQSRRGFESCVAQQPGNQLCHYYLGMIYASVKASDSYDEKKAIAELQKASDMPYAQVDLGVILRRRDENAAAERCFKRALELDPRNARAMTELGIVAKLDGRADEAVDLFAKSYQSDPQSDAGARALDELTKLRPDHALARQGAMSGPMPIDIFSSERFLAAISMIEQQFGGVEKDAPEEAGLREMINRLLKAAGISPSKMPRVAVLATTRIENAMALPNGNVYVTRALLNSFKKSWPNLPIDADHAPLAHVMAHELAHVSRQHAAQSMLYIEAVRDASARLDPAILTHTTRLQEIEADRLGMITAFLAGYPPRGGIEFMEVMGKHMEIPAHLDHPTFDERVHYLEEYWSNDIKYAFQAFKGGVAKMDKAQATEASDVGAALGLYKDALEDFRRFRDSVQPNKEVLNNMGVAYARIGVLAQSRNGSVLNNWQTGFSLERSTALKYKGLTDGASRGLEKDVPWQLTQAVELFKEAFSKDPAYRRAGLNLAVAQIAVGAPDKALEVLGRIPAVAPGPDSAEGENILGIANALTGHVPEAEKAFRTALAAQTDMPAALFNLGRLYQMAGKKGDAQGAWKSYLAHYPSGMWADAARKELSTP